MHVFQFLAVLAAALLNATLVKADLCALGMQEIGGNYFCQPVRGIQYTNVGTPGSYDRVVHMGSDGTCSSIPKAFSGPVAPLDGEVSFHIRGPARIHEFAVYVPSGNPAARRNIVDVHHHTHGAKSHKHGAGHGMKARQEVTATIDGKVVSWGNDYWGPSSIPATQVMVTATINGQVESWLNNWVPATQTRAANYPTLSASSDACTDVPSKSGQSIEVPSSTAVYSVPVASATNTFVGPPAGPHFESSGLFERISYYHAADQVAHNITFLGNYGGQGSGCFDEHYGASLAYANSAGTGGASSPQVLADTVIPSGSEVIIMRGDECGDGGCEYVRPGSVAHHGFDGADKVFMIEFTMPSDGKTGFDGDLPALWLLNAEIPRTVQYGPAQCSCWESGCGEFDIAEALVDGSMFLKSTLHTNAPAGDSDYFERPVSTSMKLAVIFSASTSTITIQVLDTSTEFAPTISNAELNAICGREVGMSHFHVAN